MSWLRLLALSFKGKVLDWYWSLGNSNINTWVQLPEPFIKEFNEVGDLVALLTQFTSIQRQVKEDIANFNFRFGKTWERFPLEVSPSPTQAYMYCLRAFVSDLALQIRHSGGISHKFIKQQ